MPLQLPEGTKAMTQEVTNTIFISLIEFVHYIIISHGLIFLLPAPTWSNTSYVISWLQHQQNLIYGYLPKSRFGGRPLCG